MVMITDGNAVMATVEIAGTLKSEALYLDPDVAALIADVDAILCVAQSAARRPSVRSVTGLAFAGRTSAGRLCGAPVPHRRGPVQPVLAVQRSPPTGRHRDSDQQLKVKGR